PSGTRPSRTSASRRRSSCGTSSRRPPRPWPTEPSADSSAPRAPGLHGPGFFVSPPGPVAVAAPVVGGLLAQVEHLVGVVGQEEPPGTLEARAVGLGPGVRREGALRGVGEGVVAAALFGAGFN